MQLSELLHIKPLGKISSRGIFYILVILYLLSVAYYYWQFQTYGTLHGYDSMHIMSILFAPIYEEILFRGIILVGLLKIFTNHTKVIVWSGILF